MATNNQLSSAQPTKVTYGPMRDPSAPKVPQVTIKTESSTLSELEAKAIAERTQRLINAEAGELESPSTQLAAQNRVTKSLKNNSNDEYGRSLIDCYLDESEWKKVFLAPIKDEVEKKDSTFVKLLLKHYMDPVSGIITEEDMIAAYQYMSEELVKPIEELSLTRSIRNRLSTVEETVREKIKRQLLADIKAVEKKLVEQPGTSYKSKTDLEAILKGFNAFIAEPDIDRSALSEGALIVIRNYQQVLDASEAVHTEAILYQDKLKKAHSGPTAFFKKQFTKIAQLFSKKS